MLLRRARSCPPWLRLPALALLLWAVLVNPVLAAVGDLHEATRGAADHLHQAQAHALADDVQDHDDPEDLLHALMHAAHCCGHPTAIPSHAAIPAVLPLHDGWPHALAPSTRSHAPALTLRPPIAA